MKIYNDIEQGSPEWMALRCGRVTMSRAKDCISKGRGSSPSLTREKYLYEIVSERLTGQPESQYTNQAMEHGTITEPEARLVYQDKESVIVDQIGFVEHDENTGCSPDGVIGKEGLLEIKCPKTSTQIRRIMENDFPSEYKAQVQGQLWICEREWCDFVSYDPRIEGPASYFKIRVHRDEKYIKELQIGIEKFIEEVERIVGRLK